MSIKADKLALLSISRIQKCFDGATLERGRYYYQQQRIVEHWFDERRCFRAKVQGRAAQFYQVSVDIGSQQRGYRISSHCSCPVVSQCKHGAALLLFLLEGKDQQLDALPNQLVAWLTDLKVAMKNKKGKNSSDEAAYRLGYLLNIGQFGAKPRPQIYAKTILQRELKKGGFGKARDINFDRKQIERHGAEVDRIICAQLTYPSDGFGWSKTVANRDKVVTDLLETKRCFFNETTVEPIQLGEPMAITFEWREQDDASQQLVCISERGRVELIFTESVWYCLEEDNIIGPTTSQLTPELIHCLLLTPELSHEQASSMAIKIEAIAPDLPSLKPKRYSKVLKKQNIKLKPVLKLHETPCELYVAWDDMSPLVLPTLEVEFDYQGVRAHELDKGEQISRLIDDAVELVPRDKSKEKKHLKQLADLCKRFSFSERQEVKPESQNHLKRSFLNGMDSEEALAEFQRDVIPVLEKDGWLIERDSSLFADVLDSLDGEWYTEFGPSENDFFSFNLGIKLGEIQVDILPAVIRLLNETELSELASFDDDETFLIDVNKTTKLAVPYSRVKPIIRTLTALFDVKKLKPTDSIKLSRAQARLLYEMEQAFAALKVRWQSSHDIIKLGERLANIGDITRVEPASEFLATLRDYQQQGLNWLQFLRENQLGGILADDMGLGKTVQALAHLSVEKEQGRLTKPCLVVAPTSLMLNWRQEADRFAPQLKTLIYHGDDRHQHKDTFEQYDLIFTTYELVARDKAWFIESAFYYLILDEAQRIKNAKAKTTQILHQLSAKHRLCLTGTPLENHLGELWSLFNFLMPGFLGTDKLFGKVYRGPIERQDNAEIRDMLVKRIQPFMLRRIKSEVVKELPDKTEIVRQVELVGKQRDVYESIRLTMEKKVRDAVAQKGIARSQIELLEALLRLRQTCCDPRLLKMDDITDSNSEKLDDLIDLLLSLLEEGRKVLLFSQFTSMLALIEQRLTEHKINYVKLTGSTKDRAKPIEQFQQGRVPLFLISLKAGGTGLNLTEADTVIHYDPWWNPAVEDQATDRSHRIGQKKAVFVYKFIAKGTVEETIQEMQQRKRALMDGLFSPSSSKKLSLSETDFKALFKPIDDL